LVEEIHQIQILLKTALKTDGGGFWRTIKTGSVFSSNSLTGSGYSNRIIHRILPISGSGSSAGSGTLLVVYTGTA